MQSWNSLFTPQAPLLIKDIKVQVSKQKPGDIGPDQMKRNSDITPIDQMSSQACSKPDVVRCSLIPRNS